MKANAVGRHLHLTSLSSSDFVGAKAVESFSEKLLTAELAIVLDHLSSLFDVVISVTFTDLPIFCTVLNDLLTWPAVTELAVNSVYAKGNFRVC